MDKIKKAIEVLKNGGIVIFPTDTAIGIGCRIDDEEAIKKLFKIRKRPRTKAFPVLFNNVEMVRRYVRDIPQDVEKLMERYWPGALTLVLHSDEVRVPLSVRGGGETLGVRIPDSEIIREIISKIGVPILGPSANFAGEKTPFGFEDLNPELIKQVDYVLNEKISPSAGGEKNVSTIINCSVEPWKIVRQGAIKIPRFTKASKSKQNAILVMDTADNKKITVGLIIDGKKDIRTEKIDSNKTQIILPMIDEILKKHKVKPENLSEIQINTGPGSFTGLRIGLAIANALSFVLGIPINDKDGEIILPDYSYSRKDK